MQNYHILKEVDIKDTFKNDVLKGIFEIDIQKIITEKIILCILMSLILI